MSPHDENDSEHSVQDLLDFVIRYETDRMADRVLTLEEYQELFPRSREAIAVEFRDMTAAPHAAGPSAWTQRHKRLDHFVLEREIGRGGQGRVFLALDTRMRRRVALKVLSRAQLSPDSLRRFQREVEIIAKLDHPGLCSVFEANLRGSQPYLAMRYVEGEDLAHKIRNAKASLDSSSIVGARSAVGLARLLQLFERAARALHAAHEAGVIHRDVKPGNILVHTTGEPVIVDFGLARDEDTDADSLTRTDDILGTPAYMAPELLESGHSSVDRRADVYALGVALYECLTLERPFAGASREGVFEQIRRGVYANPRALNALVGEDLRVVLAMAMEIDPRRRYESALALAEDLRRVREYEPIRARPAAWPIRLQRWAQRHPQLATSFALVAAVVGASLVTLTATVRRVEAESARTRAANERLLGVAFREQSGTALRSNVGLALRLAIEAERRDPGFESNMTLLCALQLSHEQRSLWPGSETYNGIYDACVQGNLVMLISNNGLVCFDVDQPKPRFSTVVQVANHRGIQVSLDGSRIAVIAESDVNVFDGQTGAPLYTFTQAGTRAESCHFSPDSRWLVTTAGKGVVQVLDARDGSRMRTLSPGTGTVTLARFDPSGRFIVTTTDVRTDTGVTPQYDFNPHLWNALTGELVATLDGYTGGVREALFAPNGEHLVTVCDKGSVRCWRVPDKALAWQRTLPGEGWSLGWSPDGQRVVAGYESGARVFDLTTGEALLDLEQFNERSVLNVAYSPDGKRIAATDYGGGVGAWDAADGSCLMKARCESSGPGGVAWLTDSTRFVTWAGGRVAHVWTTRPIPLLSNWSASARVHSCVFSPSSESVLSADERGRIELRTAVDGSPSGVWEHGAPVERAWFVGADESIAYLARDGGVFRIEHGKNAVCVSAAAEHAAVSSSEPSRDGSTVLVGFGDGHVAWIDATNGRTFFEADTGSDDVNVLALSSAGTRAAWCSGDGFGGATDRTSGATIAIRLDGSAQQVHALAFDADGNRVLVNDNRPSLMEFRFDGASPNKICGIRPLSAIVPMSDSRILSAFKWISGLSLRRAGSETELWPGTQYGERGLFVSLRVDAKEELALAASTAGFACLWRVRDGELIVRFDHGSAPLTCAEFSPDGRAVVTAAEDGSIHVWPTDLRGTAQAHVPAPPEVWQSRFPKAQGDE